jgi:hypothetical protein
LGPSNGFWLRCLVKQQPCCPLSLSDGTSATRPLHVMEEPVLGSNSMASSVQLHAANAVFSGEKGFEPLTFGVKDVC